MKYIKLNETEEISAGQMHDGKKYSEIVAKLKDNERIASFQEIQDLRNSEKYPKSFTKFWVFVPNPDKISEKNNYVARFGAGSVRAGLYCDGDAVESYDAIGVFVVRKKLKD